MSTAPKRAHHLVIEVGADDQRALVALLRHFIYCIETGSRSLVSGGYDSGGTLSYAIDEAMTHDRYFELSDAWLREREQYADSDPGQRVAPL